MQVVQSMYDQKNNLQWDDKDFLNAFNHHPRMIAIEQKGLSETLDFTKFSADDVSAD